MKNLEIEYQSLRSEIIYSDRLCVTLLTSLVTITVIFWGFYMKSEIDLAILIPLFSLIWFLGFLYITEKRFQILSIADYFIEQFRFKDNYQNNENYIEANWEKWRRDNGHKYPKIPPYLIEGTVTIIIMILNLFVAILSNTDYYLSIFRNIDNEINRGLNLTSAIISGIITLIVSIQFLSLMRKHKIIEFKLE